MSQLGMTGARRPFCPPWLSPQPSCSGYDARTSPDHLGRTVRFSRLTKDSYRDTATLPTHHKCVAQRGSKRSIKEPATEFGIARHAKRWLLISQNSNGSPVSAHHEFGVERACRFQAFQDVDHVSWRNPERVQTRDHFGQRCAFGNLGQ